MGAVAGVARKVWLPVLFLFSMVLHVANGDAKGAVAFGATAVLLAVLELPYPRRNRG